MSGRKVSGFLCHILAGFRLLKIIYKPHDTFLAGVRNIPEIHTSPPQNVTKNRVEQALSVLFRYLFDFKPAEML